MRALTGLLITMPLTVHAADSGSGVALLTLQQRDALRSSMEAPSADVSADGRYIAFVSHARLVPADNDNRADIYVFNRVTGEVSLESVDHDGAPLTGSSTRPRLSGDGRYLVFESTIRLADGVPTIQIALRDRAAWTTTWIGRTVHRRFPDGRSFEPVVSADGSVIVFTSAATDLVPEADANGSGLDVYMYTVATGHIRRISLDSRAHQRAVGASYAASVSASGRHVAFVSTAALDRLDSPANASMLLRPEPFAQIYLRDVHTGTTTRLTRSNGGGHANGASGRPVVSADGRYVAFSSDASNLVQGDRNRVSDVFLHDRTTNATVLVSRSTRRGAANGASLNPAISNDGRFVAFQSEASDLICASRCSAAEKDINLLFDVFLFDGLTRSIRRLSGWESGGWMEESGGPALGAGGDVVAFTSRHPIDSLDIANDFDLFIFVAP
jgi:Tol biopolymer transport system component